MHDQMHAVVLLLHKFTNCLLMKQLWYPLIHSKKGDGSKYSIPGIEVLVLKNCLLHCFTIHHAYIHVYVHNYRYHTCNLSIGKMCKAVSLNVLGIINKGSCVSTNPSLI